MDFSDLLNGELYNKTAYYMPSAVSGQDESRAVIGYPSGQDGAILPTRDTGFVPQEHIGVCFPYNKSFIDQACSVKMAGYWPRSVFACLWTETQSGHARNSRSYPPTQKLER